MDYLTTYGFNRIPARSVNDIWLMLQGENGAALGGKSIYFGACYGIAYDDIAVEIENPDRDMTPGNTYDGGIFYPVVSEECALEWARGDDLWNVRYKLASASMSVDGKTTLVKVNDGKFAVDTLGECTYALKYSAFMYVVKKDGSLVTESEMSAFAQKEDEVVLTVTESAEPVDIHG